MMLFLTLLLAAPPAAPDPVFVRTPDPLFVAKSNPVPVPPVVTYAPITYRPVCVNGRCYFVPVTR